ncbi:TPA: hypothetical protein QC153_004225 [Bacillus cereus]|uniref:hypothetical protein n=1 Tax=Bacillus cereus TaxID=1396 RepID=UPI000C28431C|nr:hypothetical protein [Bacillus cereus]BCC07186.1 hypothetical protein BCM0060_3449 [Bacillus cereus]HDR8245787.1 hypothetical protein [Bacillus cereus]HDR8254209.1 hypothetical protein [Bacillus cereus]HDR8304820.1 hypothetical protein [Bacillus cereus]HDR8479630.1 hypothetical protein [Bacillus cereus]
MNLREALAQVTYENRMYFQYKFPEARYRQSMIAKTEEEFLQNVSRKTLDPFLAWEKTAEYANLVALYLQSKMINDIHEIYIIVREKALKGDDKAVKLLLTLNKEVNTIVKAGQTITKTDEAVEDDGLVL